MFARTPRLLLRPGWSDDAPALASAIGDQAIVRNLAEVPWPYRRGDAEEFLAAPADPVRPKLLAFARTAGAPRLVGGAGLVRSPSGSTELGFWVARPHWGLGYATEAAAALVDIARALGLESLEAAHFLDNPASGRVLVKLGFVPAGAIVQRHGRGRGGSAPARRYRLVLGDSRRRLDEQPAAPSERELVAA